MYIFLKIHKIIEIFIRTCETVNFLFHSSLKVLVTFLNGVKCHSEFCFRFQYVKCPLKIHKSLQQCASQDTVDLMNATKTANASSILHHSISQTGRTQDFSS